MFLKDGKRTLSSRLPDAIMKNNLKVVITIAGAVILAVALPFLIWKLMPTAGTNPSGNGAGRHLTKNQMTFAGYATPEAAIQSIAWAAVNGDSQKALACFSPEMQADITNKPNGLRKFRADINRNGQQIQGLQVLARKMLADDRAEVKVKLDSTNPPNHGGPMRGLFIQPLVKIGGEWKLNGSTRPYAVDWDEGSQPVPPAS